MKPVLAVLLAAVAIAPAAAQDGDARAGRRLAGAPIGFIDLPERCANVCFGGRHRNRFFMAAAHSLYSLYVNTQGAPGG